VDRVGVGVVARFNVELALESLVDLCHDPRLCPMIDRSIVALHSGRIVRHDLAGPLLMTRLLPLTLLLGGVRADSYPLNVPDPIKVLAGGKAPSKDTRWRTRLNSTTPPATLQAPFYPYNLVSRSRTDTSQVSNEVVVYTGPRVVFAVHHAQLQGAQRLAVAPAKRLWD
jgi:hypothetical protein